MMKYLLPVPLAALIGFLAFGRGVDTKVPKPQPQGETAPTPPHIEISRRGQELVRKGEADLQLRKQKVQEKLTLLAERFDDLQTNAAQAESRWKLAIDRAFGVPRKAAENC